MKALQMIEHEIVSMTAAKLAGLTRYFTGDPCKNGHICQRMVANRQCVTCLSERNARVRLENVDAARQRDRERYASKGAAAVERVKKYYADNAEARREYRRNKYALDPVPQRKMRRDYSAANPGYDLFHTQRRRAARLMATVGWDGELTSLASREAFSLCVLRESCTGIKWELDHIIPFRSAVACGLHVWANFQVIPAVLNRKKNNRMMLTTPLAWIDFL